MDEAAAVAAGRDGCGVGPPGDRSRTGTLRSILKPWRRRGLQQHFNCAGIEFVVATVKSDSRQAPDLVERNFTAEAPDLLWVADKTYVPTWAGFLYLAVVLDAFSRRIVGWSMATTLAAQLVLDALNMALATRRPTGVIHHSDQGSQAALK
jgi:transposase InsO family protein